MNKRGDVPTILLFLVAIFFAVVALLAMGSFSSEFDNWSEQLNQMMGEAVFAKQYVLEIAEEIGNESVENCKDCSIGELREEIKRVAAVRDLGYFGVGNFFGRIRNDEFVLERVGLSRVSFEIEDLFVQAKRGRNEVKRGFDFERDYRFD
jgi:hypothetical protein